MSRPEVDVALVCGARPNFVKIAPIHRAIRAGTCLTHVLVHTGQHHDFEMSRTFFADLDLPDPRVHLGSGAGTHAEQTARIMVAFEQFLTRCRPRTVVVVGDVNSTLACSLVTAKAGIALAHVEAGLRSFDRSMPEEINRIATDAVSNILYTTCDDGTRNLLREGMAIEQIQQVGNVMIDTLVRYRSAAEMMGGVLPAGRGDRGYALVTLHRPSNVDDPRALDSLVSIVQSTSRQIAVIFPVHPRTRQNLERYGFINRLAAAGVLLLPPQSYLPFLSLMLRARVVLTDSGGIQEETTVLGIPCITLRQNTERPVTVDLGTNVVAGLDRGRIQTLVRQALEGRWKRGTPPPGWDGKAAERIANHLASVLQHGKGSRIVGAPYVAMGQT